MALRLNIGSGQRPFSQPWINVDRQAKFAPDVVADGTEYLSRLESGSVEMIVLHHVLEHYGCGEADGLLAECRRVLSSAGSLLVFVPDLRALAEGFLAGRVTEQVFLTNIYGAWMGDEADRHKWGFTRRSLDQTLRTAGFGRTWLFDWRVVDGAEIARDWWILGMEGRR